MLNKIIYEELGLAMRVTPRPIWNKKSQTSRNILNPLDVMNSHLALLDKGASFVYYSTNLSINSKKIDAIKTVLFFSYKENWAALCDAQIISKEDGSQFVPNDVSLENSSEYWLDEPNRTWIKLFNYRQINFETLDDFELENPNRSGAKTLGNLISSSKRFNRVYIKN